MPHTGAGTTSCNRLEARSASAHMCVGGALLMARTTIAALRERAKTRAILGTFLLTPGAEWVELCANTGLDFICVDQMVTTTDWRDTADMFRAAAAYRTSAWVRLKAFPWGSAPQGPVLQRDVLKAIACGADGIIASVDYPEDLAAMMAVQDDMHRKIWDGTVYAKEGGAYARQDERQLPSIMPLVESYGAFKNLRAFTEVDGVEAVFIGLGDLSRILNIADFDVDNPAIQDVLKEAVSVCRPRGVEVMTSPGYRDTAEEISRGIDQLWSLGVGIAWVSYPTYIAHRFYRRLFQIREQSQMGRKA